MNYRGIQRAKAALILATVVLASSTGVQAQLLNYKTSWVGNSFGYGDSEDPNAKWVQMRMHDMYVSPDGTCYVGSVFDEGTHDNRIYKNGTVLYPMQRASFHAMGRHSMGVITANAKYIYIGVEANDDFSEESTLNSNGLRWYPEGGTHWWGVVRHNLNGTVSKFSGAYGEHENFKVIVTTPNENENYFTGLAASSTLLFVSDPVNSRIRVYNAETMQFVRQWAVARPGKLALDSSGYLWVIQNGDTANAPRILKYSSTGVLQSSQITFASGVKPSDVAYNAATGRLMVSDAGPNQNVKLYNIASLSGSPTTVAGTYGMTGGITAGVPGQIAPLKFNNPTGVGADSSGNFYVCGTGPGGYDGDTITNSVLEGYTSSGSQLWKLYGLNWLDCAEPDPASETDVFTKDDHYTLDYNKTTAGTEWSYTGHTVNALKYPQDPRLNADTLTTAWVRRINGKRFLFTTGHGGQGLWWFRFNSATDGEIAIPSGGWYGEPYENPNRPNSMAWPPNQPTTNTEFFWRDTNGNGYFEANEFITSGPSNPTGTGITWVDANGTIWQAGLGWPEAATPKIRKIPVQGLDSVGNPIYNFSNAQTITPPALPGGATWKNIQRLVYIPATDTMYLAGYTTQYSQLPFMIHGLMGRVVYRYNNWSSTRTLQSGYPIVLPSGDEEEFQSISVAGDYVFCVERKWAGINVYHATTGALVGQIWPGPEVNYAVQTLDMGWTINAVKRSNGEYLIFCEENSHAKVLMYRWTP